MISNWVDTIIKGTFDSNNQSFNRQQQERFFNEQNKIAEQQLELAEKEYYSNVDIMNRNFGLQQQAFDYNKQQAELTRLREDNAFQRRVADTVAAGFSPLATEGFASASQAPTLTAPQYDPQGVNEATRNRLSAYQSKMQQSNVNAQLRLQSQQLKLAQIETITETLAAAQNLRSQNIINQRNQHELNWYKEHGYRDTTLNTILSDILKGVNYKGKSIGQLGADGINYALDKVLNNPDNVKKYATGASSFLASNFAKNVDKLRGFNNINDNPLKNNSKRSRKDLGYDMDTFEHIWFTGKNSFNRVSRGKKDDLKMLYKIADMLDWRGPKEILPDGTSSISKNQWTMLKNSYYAHIRELHEQGWL